MNHAYEKLGATSPNPNQLGAVAPLKAFAPPTLAFVDALSGALMRSTTARQYPELMALAFWMRKANLARLEQSFVQELGERLLVPRGTVFHVAPSNVDTIFVYSWFLALLSGNRNIVRLSSKNSAQSQVLIQAIVELLNNPEHAEIAARTLLIRYPAANKAITAELSAVCDVRVIWGGNSTVNEIRAIPIPPSAMDVAFANKYSIAMIQAVDWLAKDDNARDAEIQEFWNDAYWFDQMGCSSPRLVLWVGEQAPVEQAKQDFWARLDALLAKKQTRFSDADYVNKLMAVNSLAIDSNIHISTGTTNNLVRVWLETPALHIDYHCGVGLFFESRLETLAALRGLLSRTVQTISYSGWTKEDMRAFVLDMPLAGIDRIVPFGQALNFAPVWDGFDLTRMFMREITVK